MKINTFLHNYATDLETRNGSKVSNDESGCECHNGRSTRKCLVRMRDTSRKKSIVNRLVSISIVS